MIYVYIEGLIDNHRLRGNEKSAAAGVKPMISDFGCLEDLASSPLDLIPVVIDSFLSLSIPDPNTKIFITSYTCTHVRLRVQTL